MKIGIDARMYGARQAGLGRYIQQLIIHLEKIDTQNEYVIFLRQENFSEFSPTQPNFKKILVDVPWYGWKEQIILPKIIQKEKIDLMHFPHWNIPYFYQGNFVVTIHDLIMYHYPRAEASTHGRFIYWLKDLAHRIILKKAIKKAQKIIVPTEFTKNDLVKNFDISPEKIAVTLLSTNPPPHTAGSYDEKKFTNIAKPFILYVGNAYPHKNLEGLLKAWEIFQKKHNDQYQLVLAGKKNFFYNKLIKLVTATSLPNIIFTDFVDDATLNELYRRASLYVFPSFYEGFGLPPLEAIGHKIPVIAANTSCLPEILGNGALFFDPNNHNQIADLIGQVLNNEALREKLITQGTEILKKYSWEKTAAATIKIYEKIGKI